MEDKKYEGAATSMVRFGDRVEGFLAVPAKGAGPFPGVVLGHERYGLVQHTLDLAAKFARDGYVCIAPDLFSRWEGDKAALNRGDIQVPIVDADIKSYMSDGLDFLLQHPKVDPKKIVAMGVCQSGSFPLLLNSIRPEVTANLVIYGGAQVGEYTAEPPRRTEPTKTSSRASPRRCSASGARMISSSRSATCASCAAFSRITARATSSRCSATCRMAG
jgi:carboxymethylenebutenolidase